jgi:hypothetical protein
MYPSVGVNTLETGPEVSDERETVLLINGETASMVNPVGSIISTKAYCVEVTVTLELYLIGLVIG